MIQSLNNRMISDGCLNRGRLPSRRLGNESTSLTAQTARAAECALPSGITRVRRPRLSLSFRDSDRRARQSSGGAEAPGETVTPTNSVTSCPLRVGRASTPAKLQKARSSEEERRVSLRRRCTEARATEGRMWTLRRPRMLTATRDISLQFLVVPLQVTAGRLKQPHTTGLQVPLTSYGDSSEASPRGRARTFPLQSPGASLF